MNFLCKYCDAELMCQDDWGGEVVECPSCGKRVTVPGDPPTDGKQKKKERRRVAHQWADDANISLWKSVGVGTLFFIGFYLVVWPMHKLYFGQLFIHRGWVPFVLVFLMTWSFGILLMKWLKLRRQRAAMIIDALPTKLGETIDENNVETFIDHVDRLPVRLQTSFMVNRVRRGLEHFWLRRSNPEVVNLMNSQSDIDASAIQSSYTMIKIFIWAIPILGFIGTVIGISAAISSFSGSLDQAEDMAFLVNSINQVTSGLGVAFDTTLVALVMSLLVSFPASSLQQAEEDLLNRIDEYCNENLLKRLDDAGGVSDVALHTQRIMESMGDAMTGAQRDVLTGLRDLVEKMAALQQEQMEQSRQLSTAIEDQLNGWSLRAAEHQQHLDGRMAELLRTVEHQAGASLERNAERIDTTFNALTEGIASLNTVLSELNQKQVIIQKQEPERRGWFGRRKTS